MKLFHKYQTYFSTFLLNPKNSLTNIKLFLLFDTFFHQYNNFTFFILLQEKNDQLLAHRKIF